MAEKQETAETGGTDTLTAEEQAFFESGGEAELKDESAETDKQEAGEQGAETAEAKTETEGEGEAEKGEQEQSESPQRDEKGRFVPHQALHAEREEHKKTRSELVDMREKWARLEERLNGMSQKPEEQIEEDPEPDPEKDIFAHSAWQRRQIETLKTRLDGRDQAEQKAKEASTEEAKIWGHWDQSIAAVKTELPDFGDAAKFLSDARSKQLQAYAAVDPRFGNPAEINSQIDNELRQIVTVAMQNGTNPAKAVYDLAKSWGYAGPQAQQQDNGQMQLPEKLQQVGQAQDASRTIGQASGRASGDEITLETLDNMPETEFRAWVSKPENERKFRQLMGE